MILLFFVFFFKQKTAYELRISDWSSDVCSSDLAVKETAGSMAMDEGHRQWSQRVRLVIGNAKAVPSPGGLGGGEKGGFPRRRLRTEPRGAAAAAKAAPGDGKRLPVFQRFNAFFTALAQCPHIFTLPGFP